MLSFDYVIVGGGSAGCVLAERLSRSGKRSVCLLEAGPSDNDLRIKIPFGLIKTMGNPKFDWKLSSAAHAHLGGKSVSVPRGKVIGGSGAINSMVYIRGRASDYNRWAEMGATGWSWNDVLPVFKRQENNTRLSGELHGTDGPIHIQDLPSPHPLTRTFVKAGQEVGIPATNDFNGHAQEGLGTYQTNMRNGQRWNSSDAYLKTARRRKNLTVITGVKVSHFSLDEAKAQTVHALRGNKPLDIDVGCELILSAGAIGSPEVLMRSGIGPGSHLQSVGVDVKLDLPGVGQNLQDHPAVAVFHGGGSAGYGLTLSALPGLMLAPLNYLVRRKGLLASNTVEAGGFAKTNPALSEPNVQFHFIPARLGHEGKMIVYGRGYYCDVCLLKPRSVGALTLKGPNTENGSHIDLNLLSDPQDYEELADGLILLRQIMAANAFDSVRSPELCPGSEVTDREQIRAYIKERLGTAYHPVGTCRMGRTDDKASVVTPDLRLKGARNIRVIDASIMPEIISGNTNAPTMMIADKGSDYVIDSPA